MRWLIVYQYRSELEDLVRDKQNCDEIREILFKNKFNLHTKITKKSAIDTVAVERLKLTKLDN